MDIKKIYAEYNENDTTKRVYVKDTANNKIFFDSDKNISVEFAYETEVNAIKIDCPEKIKNLKVFFPFKAKKYIAFYFDGETFSTGFYKKSTELPYNVTALLTVNKKEFAYFLPVISENINCYIEREVDGILLNVNLTNFDTLNEICLYTAYGIDPYEVNRLATNALIVKNGLKSRIEKQEIAKKDGNVSTFFENLANFGKNLFNSKNDLNTLSITDKFSKDVNDYIKDFGFISYYANEYCLSGVDAKKDDIKNSKQVEILKAISGANASDSDKNDLLCDACLMPLANCILDDPLDSKKPFILTNYANNQAVVACFNLTNGKVKGKFRPFQFLEGGLMDGYVLFDHFTKTGRIISHMESIKVNLGYGEYVFCTLTRIVNGKALVGFIDNYVKSKTYYVDEDEGFKTDYHGEFAYWSFDSKITINGTTIEGEKKGELYYATI
jgi:hypothetical protein